MSDFDPVAVRELSWRQVRQDEGLRSNPDLPLLDSNLRIRQSAEAVGARLLCMHAVAAHALGFPLEATCAWVDREGLRNSLSDTERRFLAGTDQKYVVAMQIQVNSIYALAWCASLISDFSAYRRMPDDLVSRLPDLLKSESSYSFRTRIVLRSREEILPQLDAAYCYHWAWQDARSSLKRMYVIPEPIEYRRKALEWMVGGGEWDEVSLDT
jgi:hypothetical protein